MRLPCSRTLHRHPSLSHPVFLHAPRDETIGLRDTASHDHVRERGDHCFGECTHAATSNNDFFPDIHNILSDMDYDANDANMNTSVVRRMCSRPFCLRSCYNFLVYILLWIYLFIYCASSHDDTSILHHYFIS